MKNFEKIDRMRVPDDDMEGWIKTLRESDMTNEEIDWMLSHINPTYAKESGTYEAEVERSREEFYKEFGREWLPKEEKYFRDGIKIRMGIENNNDG